VQLFNRAQIATVRTQLESFVLPLPEKLGTACELPRKSSQLQIGHDSRRRGKQQTANSKQQTNSTKRKLLRFNVKAYGICSAALVGSGSTGCFPIVLCTHFVA